MFSKNGSVSQIGVLGMAKPFRFTKVLNIWNSFCFIN